MRLFISLVFSFVMFTIGYGAGMTKGYDNGYADGAEQAPKVLQEMAYQSIVKNITYCESRDIHDRTSWAGAYGRAQFMDYTFKWMKGLAGRPELEWRSEKDQMWLLNWAIRHGYGKHWQTCYRQAVVKTSAETTMWVKL